MPEGATADCLRHTRATRLLLSGVAVRLVASMLDTSIVMLEKVYSKNIASHGDAAMRNALVALDEAPAGGNVVALKR